MAPLTKVIDVIKDVFSQHDRRVQDRAAMVARHTTEAAALTKALALAEAEVFALDEPRRRLERLRAEVFSLGLRHDSERAVSTRALQESRPRELARYLTLLDRLFDLMRASPVPSPEHDTNEITGARTTTNRDAIAKHLAFGGVLNVQRGEARDRLSLLPSAALTARLAELRVELEQAVAGTAFENQIA